MAKHKYRIGPGSKLKAKHHMIPGLREKLEEMAEWPSVQTIIPARISRKNGSKADLWLKPTTDTPTGVKVIAQLGNAVQEVFIVTPDVADIRARLTARIERLKGARDAS